MDYASLLNIPRLDVFAGSVSVAIQASELAELRGVEVRYGPVDQSRFRPIHQLEAVHYKTCIAVPGCVAVGQTNRLITC